MKQHFALRLLFFLESLLLITSCTDKQSLQQKGYEYPGKPEWKPMLEYLKVLHEKSTHSKSYPFDYDWEEIGPGYYSGTAFGHWDIVHQVFDALVYDPEHGIEQLYNDVKNQEPTGLIPGSIWMPGGMSGREEVRWNKDSQGHPPVWVVAVDDYVQLTGNNNVLKTFYPSLIRQITWFENERKSNTEGFFYNDILLKKWESGVDEGIRFDEVGLGKWACIDATSHAFMMYKYAEKWSEKLGFNASYFSERKTELKNFINDSLYYSPDSMYYDIWAIHDTSKQNLVFENFWPMIAGAIDQQRADVLIDNYLLNESHFFTPHPVATVSVSNPKFELRMWRGPAWNSMTYWIARGCLNYNRVDAAKVILEKALDATAKQFKETGEIWEFYHPFGGSQTELQRKPHSKYNSPSKDYLGHNPLIAMAKIYDDIAQK